jgi:hypothetical protein
VTDLEMWALLVGVALPPLVSIVEQPRWPNWFRAVVGVAASVVAGGVTTWLTAEGALWDQGMLHAILLVGVAAWASYQSFWKPTKVAPVIEAKTDIGAGPD